MTRALELLATPPLAALQDLGRPGLRAFGVSRGGAVDRLALKEAAALLGQAPDHAALELAGPGGRFRATGDLRVALTGAPMAAQIDGVTVAWNACHALPVGAVLTLGAARKGIYGYLSVGGGFQTAPVLNSRSVNALAGLGTPCQAGDLLPVGADAGTETGLALPEDDRFSGGVLRVLDGPQTALFDPALRERFFGTDFKADPRSNRQGLRLQRPGDPFAAQGGLSILSEAIVPGDIQVTGDGTPYVLLADCQTTGGYPRIGTVHPDDLARAAQAAPGTVLRFQPVTAEDALADYRAARKAEAGLARARYPLIRDPADVADLLSLQLISGVTAGDDLGD